VKTEPSPKPKWMAITQVCRRWRTITANCKDFWSYIPLQTSAYWAQVSLERSSPCPISFSVDFSTAPRPEWYRNAALSALKAISRARQVHLQGSTVSDSEFRKEALRLLDVSSAPVLEAFSVQGHTPKDTVVLSGNIFLCRAATELRSLTLTYCDVHLSSPLFRAPLQTLRLVNCYVEFPLQVLRLLPQLRTLVLENTHGARIRNSSDPLRLPQLRHLELKNPSNVIAFLLQGILISSSSSSLSITCTDYVDTEEPLDDLTILRAAISNLSPVLSTYLERALVEGYNFPLLEIASPTSTAKKTLILLDPAGTHQLHFSLMWAGTPTSVDLFFEMLSTLPTAVLQRIHTLRMQETPLRTADAQSRLLAFAAFHDKARDEAVRGLLAIVMGRKLLPELRLVSLEGVDFKDLDVDMLARVLVHRQRLSTAPGGKIYLSLQNCLVDLATIRGLQDCLGDAVNIT
jgi:hypothetical protein